MSSGLQVPQQKLIQIAPWPQCVPSRACFSCDVCCRFPEAESFLRPYFTAEEIQRAVSHGLDPAHFPEPTGCQVALVPNPSGEGYLCSAFDPMTNQCRIYEARPLDCRIYPLALMWGAPAAGAQARGTGREARDEKPEVVLGWDTKCPFLAQSAGSRFEVRGSGQDPPAPRASRPAPDAALRAYAGKIAAMLERDEVIETFAQNPRLVGPFQDDVVILKSLPRLSERLRVRHEARGEWETRRHGDAATSPCHPFAVSPLPLAPGILRPLTLADRPRFEHALKSVETPLAHYALAPHLIWMNLFRYSWGEIEDHVCLFAEYSDGIFMPLPPLPLAPVGRDAGSRFEVRGSGQDPLVPRTPCPAPDAAAFSACFAFMRERNRGSAVTRVENVPEEWVSELQALGYRLTPKDPDYLYRAEDLARLAGDRYKSQRAACNRFQRIQHDRYEPYQPEQAEACLALYRRWVAQQEARDHRTVGTVARQMLKDSASAHQSVLAHHRDLGLVGYVVWVDDAIQAYTFGFERTSSVWCVLLEVADRTMPGLAQFIFREFCRGAAARGYAFINSMDDSGLPSLARSKRAYRPCRLVSNFILSER